jgi:hypothetical protein
MVLDIDQPHDRHETALILSLGKLKEHSMTSAVKEFRNENLGMRISDCGMSLSLVPVFNPKSAFRNSNFFYPDTTSEEGKASLTRGFSGGKFHRLVVSLK